MSDLHVWRPSRAASEAAMAEFYDFHQVLEVEAKKAIAEHGDHDPAAQALRKVWNQLDEVGSRMRAHLTEPRRLQSPSSGPMGETTEAWTINPGRQPMRRNRGPR